MSGNRLEVNTCQVSGFLFKGIPISADLDLFDGVWLEWTFQENFMFKPILQAYI